MGTRLHPTLSDPRYPALRPNQRVFGRAVQLARVSGGGTVLDVGCGNRPFAAASDGFAYVGTDIEFEPRPSVVADTVRLPFGSDSFALVIASETIEHTREYGFAVREIIRVTRPGGIMFVSVPFMYPAARNASRLPAPYRGRTASPIRGLLGLGWVGVQ